MGRAARSEGIIEDQTVFRGASIFLLLTAYNTKDGAIRAQETLELLHKYLN